MTPKLLLVLAGLCVSPALAVDVDDECCAGASLEFAPIGFDEATGRIVKNFPPDRAADCEHMRLEVTIPDMNTPRATCRAVIRATPIAAPLSQWSLDARSMKIMAASCEGHEVSFDHDGRVLTLHFSPAPGPGEAVEVAIDYELNDPPRGMIWTPESDRYPGRAAQIHTQGQTDTNSFWFPCHDSPNEKLTTEIIAHVPAGYTVSSNGALAEHTTTMIDGPGPLGAKRLIPAESFHFVQDKPHAPYLVSLVVGKFDVVDVGDKALQVPVYAPPGRGSDAAKTYAHTIDMIRFFEKRIDEPYPWARYAQQVVLNFEAGGMENTGATSMHDNAVVSDAARLDYDLDGLISHELGHQWFGDLTTCNSWDQIWLNEGFATYMSCLWFEHRDGADRYAEEVREKFDAVLAADTGSAPDIHAMISRVYKAAFENFRRPGNPYPKGASILHMLRRELGDDIFFASIADFVNARKLQTVQTYQLRKAFEARSGRQLERFFEQWTQRPGTPTVKVSWVYDPQRRKLRFTTEQKQTIDPDNPSFEFSLPVFIKNSAGPDVMIEPFLFAKSDTFEVELEGPPRFVAVDPDLHVLARFEVEQDPAMWLSQLRDGPTLLAKVQAARGLGKAGGLVDGGAAGGEASATEYLRRLASDAKAPMLLRKESVKALTARGNASDLRTLVSTARDHWEVRQAVTDGLISLAKKDKEKADKSLQDFVTRTLLARATGDESLRVRCTAIRGLGQLKITEGESIIRQAIEVSSQSDDARQAGLVALADLETPDALAIAIAYAQEGSDNRTRGVAIDQIAKLARTDKGRALQALRSLSTTRSARPAMGAIEALADTGESDALPILAEAAARARAPEIATRITQQREKLEKKIAEKAKASESGKQGG